LARSAPGFADRRRRRRRGDRAGQWRDAGTGSRSRSE